MYPSSTAITRASIVFSGYFLEKGNTAAPGIGYWIETIPWIPYKLGSFYGCALSLLGLKPGVRVHEVRH